VNGSRRPIQPEAVWVAGAFLAFAAVVLAANGVLIWFATASWTGLVTESPYEKGLTYNRNLEVAARQAALGWQTRFAAELTGGLEGRASLELRDRQGAPLSGAEVVASFERPLEDRLDFVVPLRPAGAGTYRADFAAPVPGAWNVHVTVRRDGELHVVDERVTLR
jgi:nitrogen fixation protein FixH